MIEQQRLNTHFGALSESASFEAEDCLGMLELTPRYTISCGRCSLVSFRPITDSHVADSQQTWDPTLVLEATQSIFQETGPLESPTCSFSRGMN